MAPAASIAQRAIWRAFPAAFAAIRYKNPH
jgi:hypothetical protein